jgi:hypothetical protein
MTWWRYLLTKFWPPPLRSGGQISQSFVGFCGWGFSILAIAASCAMVLLSQYSALQKTEVTCPFSNQTCNPNSKYSYGI